MGVPFENGETLAARLAACAMTGALWRGLDETVDASRLATIADVPT